jgi:hypothetical protein
LVLVFLLIRECFNFPQDLDGAMPCNLVTCRSFKRLFLLTTAVLSVFGLLISIANDSGSKLPTKLKEASSKTIVLRFLPYKSKFCVLYNYWEAKDEFNQTISLVLHATAEYLHFLEEHVGFVCLLTIRVIFRMHGLAPYL